jgi:WNK lysine deficient protein kinase
VNNKQEQPIDKSEPIAESTLNMDESKKNLNTTADEQSAQAKQQQGGQLASQPSAQNLADLASQKADASQKSDQYESEKEKELDMQEDEKPIDESPDKRFLKYDVEIGHGSFKTVYKGLDTESGVPVAWCELHVSSS